MRAQRAVRFRGDPDEKKPKPLPPLRERIDPTAKALNDLDQQELELERRYAQTNDSDEYFDLLSVIDTKREALTRRAERLRGTVRPKDSSDSPVVLKRATERPKRHYDRPLSKAGRKSLGRTLFFGIIVILLIKALLGA